MKTSVAMKLNRKNEGVFSFYLNCFVLIAFSLLISFSSYGISKKYSFSHYSINNGLPHSVVKCAIQDKKGLLWFGTGDGLVRYDGYNFIVYKSEINNPTTLSNNIINCISEDNEGFLWIGTLFGLNKFDPQTGVNHRYLPEKENRNSLEKNEVSSVYIDTVGNVYVGQRGFQKLDVKANVFTTIDTTGIFINPINHISKDESGNLWVSSGDGLYIFDPKNNTLENFLSLENQNINQNAIFNANVFFGVLQDIRNSYTLWICTDIGIFQLNKTNKDLTLHQNQTFSKSTGPNDLRCFYQDKSGKIWLGTESNGIYVFNTDNLMFEANFRNEQFSSKSLSGNNITFIYGDSSGEIWIGTFGSGVNVTSLEQKKFRTYLSSSTDYSSIAKNTVWALLEDSHGLIWVGTQEGGIKVINTESGVITEYTSEKHLSKSIGGGVVSGIGEDKNGIIWATTWNGTLNRIDPKTKKVTIFTGGGQRENELIGWSFRSIFIDNTSDIWLGSMGSGLEVFNIKNGRSKKYIFNYESETIDVYAIYKGKSGNLWCGTSLGVYKINPKTYDKELFAVDITNPNALQCADFFGFYEESDSVLWIATQGCGIYRMNTMNGRLINYNSSNGLPTDNIYAIYPDNNEFIWMSTSNGISRFNLKDKTFRNYYESDGLQSNEFKWGAHFKNDHNEILFGGINGFNIFNPDSIVDNPNKPKTILTGFKISNKNITPGELVNKKVILTKFIEYTKELKLSYKDSDLSFEFSALQFSAPEKNIYAYQMEGYDKDWIYTNADKRFAIYTNLPPGEYTFRVKSTNNDGLWCNKEDEVSLRIEITPPFWKTRWFQVILISIILGLVYTWFLIKTRSLRLQKIVLERKIDERTNEIKKQKEKLSQQNNELAAQADNLQEANILLKDHADKLNSFSEELKIQGNELFQANKELIKLNATKDRFFTIIAHDLRNPFQTILSNSEMLIKKFKMFDKDEMLQILGLVNNASKNAYNLLENLLEWSHSQTENTKCNPETFNILEIIESIKALLSLQAQNKNIQIQINIPHELSAYADPAMAETVFRNIISNAIKFTPEGGTISVQGKIQDDFTTISVADTGIGMSEKNIKRLFKIDTVPVKQGTKGERGTGLGLIIANEFIHKNKGKIDVNSTPGKGTTFTISLPTNQQMHIKQELNKTEDLPNSTSSDESTPLDFKPLLSPDGNQYHILVVDDNPNIRKGIIMQLQTMFNLSEVSNGKDGLNQALVQIPDLIISDVMMPEMDGFELCRRLKQDERTNHIPVILLTARLSDKSKIEGFKWGADDYITKPFSAEILKARVYNLLTNREKLKEKYNQLIVSIDVTEQEKVSIDDVNKQFIDKLANIISNHINDSEFSVDDLGKEVGMSHSTLYRKLTGISNQSPSELIKTIRIKKAAYLIKKGSKQISEAMYAVGIKDASYFTKMFKKQIGVTPTEYLRMNERDTS